MGSGDYGALPRTGVAVVSPIKWWQWLPIFHWRLVGAVESADEVPARLPRNGVVAVGPESAPKWIAFDCPCRAGHRIMLNTDRARRPHWSITSSRRRLTITPSVDSQRGSQRCHYVVLEGHIRWV